MEFNFAIFGWLAGIALVLEIIAITEGLGFLGEENRAVKAEHCSRMRCLGITSVVIMTLGIFLSVFF